MKLSQFKFNLPAELIAQHPARNRDESRLMVVNRRDGSIEHRTFKDILDYVDAGDVFVLNNTKVFPARLYGEKEKTGAKIEVMLLRELNHESRLWDVLVDPARKIRIGNKLYFGENDDLVAEVIDNTTSRGRTLRFLFDGTHEEFKKTITELGNTPIPVEIQHAREKAGEEQNVEEDAENYQTVFAKCEGAVAAPTAGMHFSKSLMKHLELRDVQFAELTLHTGVGNFRDIEVEDLTKHKTDSEEMEITQETCDIINAAKAERHKIKALETSVTISGQINPYKGWTNKFIFPHYDFNTADALITNFHLPKSSMMMEVAAFAGYDLLMKAYKTAVAEKYRFFTYGDAMLIL